MSERETFPTGVIITHSSRAFPFYRWTVKTASLASDQKCSPLTATKSRCTSAEYPVRRPPVKSKHPSSTKNPIYQSTTHNSNEQFQKCPISSPNTSTFLSPSVQPCLVFLSFSLLFFTFFRLLVPLPLPLPPPLSTPHPFAFSSPPPISR